jgi:hypothetical protein
MVIDLPRRQRRHRAMDAEAATAALLKQGRHRGTPSAPPRRREGQRTGSDAMPEREHLSAVVNGGKCPPPPSLRATWVVPMTCSG